MASRAPEAGPGDDRDEMPDPHGKAPADEAGAADPKGTPNSDRHDTESAASSSNRKN